MWKQKKKNLTLMSVYLFFKTLALPPASEYCILLIVDLEIKGSNLERPKEKKNQSGSLSVVSG